AARPGGGGGGGGWVGTLGGVRGGEPGGAWRKFTRLDGLPGHETRGLEMAGEKVIARFPEGTVAGEAGRGRAMAPRREPPEQVEQQTAAARWRGAPCVATPAALYLGAGKTR